MASIQNLGMWALSILAGVVLDKTNPEITPEVLAAGTGNYDYTQTMLMFAVLGAVGVLFALGLKWVDRGKKSHGLELPSEEAADLNAARRENGEG
jgi:hypothetical protein